MVKGSLVVKDNKVVFRQNDGGITKLCSRDIYRLAFDRHEELELVEPLTQSCPDITFQSSVKPVGLRIFVSDSNQIFMTAALDVSGSQHEISTDEDHCIIEDNWYPLERGTLSSVRENLLDKEATSCGYKLDMKRYSELYQMPDRTFPIFENISDDQWQLLLNSIQQPSELELELYPYQLIGFRWLSTLVENGAGCILADEMGLGKTPQVISLISHIHKEDCIASLLVVPLTLIENWRRELHKFAPHLIYYVHHGDERVNLASEIPTKDADIVITTYDTMVRDINILDQVDWNLMLLDEAQAIKNAKAQRTIISKKVSAKSKIAITGTPLENRPDDLWSIGDFVNPGFFGTLDRFKEMSEFTPENIPKALKAVLLRREAKDVLKDLPDLISMDVAIPMYSGEESFYIDLLDSLRNKDSSRINMGGLTTLRRATAHPGLVEKEFFEQPFNSSAKLTKLFEDLSEIRDTGGKAIISCEWIDLLDLIASLSISELELPSWIINGSTPAKDRLQIVDQFSDRKGGALLAINPQAAGVGLNIQAASHVFHYTLPWNPAIEDQVTKRALRIGQTRPVVRHRPYYYDTIDEVIWNLLLTKKDLFEDLVPGNDQIPPIDILNEILNTKPKGGY